MAKLIPLDGAIRILVSPLTLTALQGYVHGFVEFIELSSGDLIVVNEESLNGLGGLNMSASALAGQLIYGHVVLCEPNEIA